MRHIPEAGAVCGNSARTDLCGGRGETSVPTATDFSLPRRSSHCWNKTTTAGDFFLQTVAVLGAILKLQAKPNVPT